MRYSTWVSTIKVKGKRYHYSRFPPHFGLPSVRLSDNFDKAKVEAVALLIDSIRSSSVGEYLKVLLARSVRRAAGKSLEHSLSGSDLIDMLARSGGRCALSGISFDLLLGEDAFDRPFAPSVDRIDNRRGYTADNCRLVCRIVNFAMGRWGYEALREVAHAIAALDPPAPTARVRTRKCFAIDPELLGKIRLDKPRVLQIERPKTAGNSHF